MLSGLEALQLKQGNKQYGVGLYTKGKGQLFSLNCLKQLMLDGDVNRLNVSLLCMTLRRGTLFLRDSDDALLEVGRMVKQ